MLFAVNTVTQTFNGKYFKTFQTSNPGRYFSIKTHHSKKLLNFVFLNWKQYTAIIRCVNVVFISKRMYFVCNWPHPDLTALALSKSFPVSCISGQFYVWKQWVSIVPIHRYFMILGVQGYVMLKETNEQRFLYFDPCNNNCNG